MCTAKIISASVLIIVGSKCTLAASYCATVLVSHGEYADMADRQTDGRQAVFIMLSATNAVNVLVMCSTV